MIFTALASALALATAPESAAEVRLCEKEIRTAPLNDERGVQSALVQGFAVVNRSGAPIRLSSVRIELSNKGEVRDLRTLSAADVAAAAKQSAQIAMIAQYFPSQFCNGRMLDGAKLAQSAELAPGEALVFMYQPFAWKGVRDRIDIVAIASTSAAASGSRASLPIVSTPSKTKALFPVAGNSFVGVGASFHTPHRWASIEEFAYDIAMFASGGRTYMGNGTKLEQYAVFGKPVRAVADGKIVAAKDGEADNVAMLKQPGEADDAYLSRLQQAQLAHLAQGIDKVLGNHVVIDHGNGEYSIYAHLKQGSIGGTVGGDVKAGQPIGAVGSSGNSTEPHLHFQMCNEPDVSNCRPLPVSFVGFHIPWEFAPRSIQSGDIVEAGE